MFLRTTSAPIRSRNIHNLASRIADNEFLHRNPRYSATERRVDANPYPSALNRRAERLLCSL